MRRETIQAQRNVHGRKVVAVLPIHYPKELLTAMNVLAVELWGPPGSPRSPDAGRIQTYVCSLVRNALAFLAAGGADEVDAVLFPHTCDSIQGLASLAPDFGGWGKPVLRYTHPKGEMRDSSRRLVRRELESFTAALAELTGSPLDSAALRSAIELHREIDELRRGLLAGRTRLPLRDLELYRLLRRGEFLWPADHRDELREALAQLADAPVQRGAPLMVTGYVPEPMGLLEALGDAGAVIVADDYAAIGRRIPPRPAATTEDPLDELVDRAFAAPPCPTLGSNQKRRLDHLEQLFDESGAAGLILHTLKFCEPELFDVPAIRKRFGERGTPLLAIEGELESELSGQALTRLEAFVEMVDSARRAA